MSLLTCESSKLVCKLRHLKFVIRKGNIGLQSHGVEKLSVYTRLVSLPGRELARF